MKITFQMFAIIALLSGFVISQNSSNVSLEGKSESTNQPVVSTEAIITTTAENVVTTAATGATTTSDAPSTTPPSTTTTPSSITNATTAATTTDPSKTTTQIPSTTSTEAPKTNSTTIKPTATPTTTPHPPPPATGGRRFDGPSFFGGIILSFGLIAICYVAFKFYRSRTEHNYHSLQETVHM